MRSRSLPVQAVDQHQPVDGQVGVDLLQHVCPLREEGGQSPGSDHGHRPRPLGADAGAEPLDEPDVSPVDPRLHAGDGIRPHHHLGLGHVDEGQRRRRVVQRLERQVDPGRDHPAHVGAVEVDHVEGRRGAEVDDDEIAAVAVPGAHGVDQPVGAHRGGADRP